MDLRRGLVPKRKHSVKKLRNFLPNSRRQFLTWRMLYPRFLRWRSLARAFRCRAQKLERKGSMLLQQRQTEPFWTWTMWRSVWGPALCICLPLAFRIWSTKRFSSMRWMLWTLHCEASSQSSSGIFSGTFFMQRTSVWGQCGSKQWLRILPSWKIIELPCLKDIDSIWTGQVQSPYIKPLKPYNHWWKVFMVCRIMNNVLIGA